MRYVDDFKGKEMIPRHLLLVLEHERHMSKLVDVYLEGLGQIRGFQDFCSRPRRGNKIERKDKNGRAMTNDRRWQPDETPRDRSWQVYLIFTKRSSRRLGIFRNPGISTRRYPRSSAKTSRAVEGFPEKFLKRRWRKTMEIVKTWPNVYR